MECKLFMNDKLPTANKPYTNSYLFGKTKDWNWILALGSSNSLYALSHTGQRKTKLSAWEMNNEILMKRQCYASFHKLISFNVCLNAYCRWK